ncbi:MAG: MerR family DNA-binding transcriptional regulator [Sulfuritalea sp.]|nr:MerR family DNA-binding transcriptional regulator [Sulfuritalea sp.]
MTGKARSRSKQVTSAEVVEARAEDTVAAHRGGDETELSGITELARELGVTQRAIRLYEARGLLAPRRINGGRAYTRRDRVRLALILRGRAMGLSLAEIEHILSLYGDHGEGHAKQLEYLVGRIEAAIGELDSRRRDIETTLGELRTIHGELERELAARRRGRKAVRPS